MKRIIAMTTALVMTVCLVSCGEVEEITMQNSSSQLYTEEEMDTFMEDILFELKRGQTIADRVYYLGDEYCSDKAVLDKLNKVERERYGLENYTECVAFGVDWHYRRDFDMLKEYGLDYFDLISLKVHDYNIIYARTDDGEWECAYESDGDILDYIPPEDFQ